MAAGYQRTPGKAMADADIIIYEDACLALPRGLPRSVCASG